MHAYIVVDLGFGDSGKGLLTDFLVRRLDAGVVVRYNGGAQAGHNVVTPDGRHHTFSQFGSGTFIPGVKTYLSHHVVIHPQGLLVEGDVLEGKGVSDAFSRLRISDQALVITPFHQSANRIRETVRAENRHGSCGIGVGETVEHALAHPEDRVLAGDLIDPALLKRKLRTIREQMREDLIAYCKDHSFDLLSAREFEVFDRDDVIDKWVSFIARISELGLIVPDSVLERWLHETTNVVFEGAQGVLLDEEAGFHPFTTWSRCTAVNALGLINQMSPDSSIHQIGVMRSYAVRHGPGPMPTETEVLKSIVSEHNQQNEWQGEVRYGWYDAVLARYALEVVKVDSLAVTHLDALPHLKTWKYCVGYKGQSDSNIIPIDANVSDGVLANIHPQRDLTLSQRTQFTQTLSGVTPVLETCDPDKNKVIQKIESLVQPPIGIISFGPSAKDVEILNSIRL